MTLLNTIYISIGVAVVLFILLFIAINFTRNFFTRSRYIKVETFYDDKTVQVKYYKKQTFNNDNGYIINPNHVFISRGYINLIFTEHTRENINPLDFESKYDANMYKIGIETKLMNETWGTLKVDKVDTMKILVIINMVILALLAYMIMKSNGIM
jgi:hypothetical protein